MDFFSSGWVGAIFSLVLFTLMFYMLYYVWLATFCHVDGNKFYERFTDRGTTRKAVQLGIGKCPHCYKKISRLATKCPHCTADFKTKTPLYKRIVLNYYQPRTNPQKQTPKSIGYPKIQNFKIVAGLQNALIFLMFNNKNLKNLQNHLLH